MGLQALRTADLCLPTLVMKQWNHGAKRTGTGYTVTGRLHAARYPIAPFVELLHESTAVFF